MFGAVMVRTAVLLALGTTGEFRSGVPTAHGEMDCFRRVGRRPNYDNVTLYTTLSPCMMCAGTVVQFGIPRVVVGEDRNFSGNIEFLESHNVEVVLLNDPQCEKLMRRFKSEKPDLWYEDIAGRERV